MSLTIASQSYGKAQVCLSYIDRKESQHDFVQLTVEVALEGQFDAAYTDGDNSMVIPTDTMKNTVYAIARKGGIDSIESYAHNLATHFRNSFDQVSKVTISVVQSLWSRMQIDGAKHKHSFLGGGSEKNTCSVVASSEGVSMTSGLMGLQVLKTTDSGFENFFQDQFTTLPPTSDRIFATTITAQWPCDDLEKDWTAVRIGIRQKLLDVFATEFSPSVQKTLYDMAAAVFESCADVNEISLNMPNQHHILANMAKLNLENDNDIFVPTPEPFGVISATVQREA